jgi:hypothetical protein
MAAATVASLLGLCWAMPARADGFHNAALVTGSVDQWLAEVEKAIPDLRQRMEEIQLESGRDVEALKRRAKELQSSRRPGRARRGGEILANLTPEQQALLARKGQDCLELLAYLDRKNIMPNEFPNFPLGKIAEYRQAAKRLLGVMGAEGTRQVVARIREDLMTGTPQSSDCGLHASYRADLLDLLKRGMAAGSLSADDLRELLQATQGQKNSRQSAIGKNLQQALAVENLDLPCLIALSEAVKDSGIRLRITRQLQERARTATVLELLRALAATSDSTVVKTVRAELAGRSPTFKEVQEELPEIWKHARSDNSKVAQAAVEQMTNAFLRAPIGRCLDWLATEDKELRSLIWAQIDDRIGRADEAKRNNYAAAALAVLEDAQAEIGNRLAALELLGRLKDARHAPAIVELLARLPRDLWPQAGSTLRDLTGQDFGPHTGDGVAEVVAARNKWRQWLSSKSEK